MWANAHHALCVRCSRLRMLTGKRYKSQSIPPPVVLSFALVTLYALTQICVGFLRFQTTPIPPPLYTKRVLSFALVTLYALTQIRVGTLRSQTTQIPPGGGGKHSDHSRQSSSIIFHISVQLPALSQPYFLRTSKMAIGVGAPFRLAFDMP